MEFFKEINWHPSLEDIIDNEFVDGKRLERTSVMYQNLRGTFTDPFADVYEDFKDMVTQSNFNVYESSKQTITKPAAAAEKENIEEKKEKDSEEPEKLTKYYPGIMKTAVNFPRWSSLTLTEHVVCSRVLLQFLASDKPDLSKINTNDLQIYMNLQTIICDEQTEFLKFAQKQWDCNHLKLIEEGLINLKWQYKTRYIEQLPRYYVEVGTLPFISTKNINICFNNTILQMGKIPRLILPKLVRRTPLSTNTSKMKNQYFTFTEPFTTKNLVSEDIYCSNYVESYNVDLVISSSGLNCLAANLDESENFWALPVVVKEVNGKNVVFVNKPLPHVAKNIMQKNSWIYKYILKSHLLHANHVSSMKLDGEESKQDLEGVEKNPLITEGNRSYNIFTIGSCGSPQNPMMKDKVERDFTMLVRTKSDGVEIKSSKRVQSVILAPKMEYQAALGAEAITLQEASRQWASLTFRPHTSLIRVRINSENSDIIMYERKTAESVSSEMKRLYNVKGEASLQAIYNFVECMTKMAPGKYLVRHTIRNGAFATVYKESTATSKNVIDLQAIYSEKVFWTLPNPSWPLIDKFVMLPMNEFFQRMPAMFRPDKKKCVKRGRKRAASQYLDVSKDQKSPVKKKM